MSWIIDRARERSTWIGLTGLASAIGLNLQPEVSEAIVSTGLAAASLISILTTDRRR